MLHKQKQAARECERPTVSVLQSLCAPSPRRIYRLALPQTVGAIAFYNESNEKRITTRLPFGSSFGLFPAYLSPHGQAFRSCSPGANKRAADCETRQHGSGLLA